MFWYENDDYWYEGYWPDVEGAATAAELCPAFRLFKRDCELEIKGWADSGEYQRTTPFGGPHHQEPSGAEI